MKKIIVIVLALQMVACGKRDTATSADNALFTAMKATAPQFSPSTTLMVANTKGGHYRPLSDGDTITNEALHMAYMALHKYSYPEDNGKVDSTSIFADMFTAGMYLDDATSVCATIASTSAASIAPYNFGTDLFSDSYTCGGSTTTRQTGYGQSVAYIADGTLKKALISYRWGPDPTDQITLGTFQVQHDSGTGDLNLNFAQSVYYPGTSSQHPEVGGFGIRTWISGNSTTHTFSLKLSGARTSTHSLTGYGISQGTGEYFLFKDAADSLYYCIPAEATEADLAGLTGTAGDAISADCSAYKDEVDALTPFTPATDCPKSDLTEFDSGVAGDPYKYLMF